MGFSPDGRYFVYAYTLGVTGTQTDIRMFDLATGSNVLLYGGRPFNHYDSPAFSGDGSEIVYRQSFRFNPGQILISSVGSSAAINATPTLTGAAPNGQSYMPSFSPDGTSVLYDSHASNLVAGDTNGFLDLFRKNLIDGQQLRQRYLGQSGQRRSVWHGRQRQPQWLRRQ